MNSSITKVIKLNTIRPSYLRYLSKEANSSNKQPNASKTDDSSTYKVPEYYQFNHYSYFDIEKEMVKYRQKQPSSLPHHEYSWSHVPPTTQNKK